MVVMRTITKIIFSLSIVLFVTYIIITHWRPILTIWSTFCTKSLTSIYKKKGIETCKISCMKRVASPGSMHDTGCLGLVHWDDPEGWNGEGGGRRNLQSPFPNVENAYQPPLVVIFRIRWFSEVGEENNSEISRTAQSWRGTPFLSCWLHQWEVFWLRTSRV